jgi:hypothetical protein
MGLMSVFICTPTPLANIPDYRLPTFIDLNVMHSDLLLASRAILEQCFHLAGEGSYELVIGFFGIVQRDYRFIDKSQLSSCRTLAIVCAYFEV